MYVCDTTSQKDEMHNDPFGANHCWSRRCESSIDRRTLRLTCRYAGELVCRYYATLSSLFAESPPSFFSLSFCFPIGDLCGADSKCFLSVFCGNDSKSLGGEKLYFHRASHLPVCLFPSRENKIPCRLRNQAQDRWVI